MFPFIAPGYFVGLFHNVKSSVRKLVESFRNRQFSNHLFLFFVLGTCFILSAHLPLHKEVSYWTVPRNLLEALSMVFLPEVFNKRNRLVFTRVHVVISTRVPTDVAVPTSAILHVVYCFWRSTAVNNGLCTTWTPRYVPGPTDTVPNGITTIVEADIGVPA